MATGSKQKPHDTSRTSREQQQDHSRGRWSTENKYNSYREQEPQRAFNPDFDYEAGGGYQSSAYWDQQQHRGWQQNQNPQFSHGNNMRHHGGQQSPDFTRGRENYSSSSNRNDHGSRHEDSDQVNDHYPVRHDRKRRDDWSEDHHENSRNNNRFNSYPRNNDWNRPSGSNGYPGNDLNDDYQRDDDFNYRRRYSDQRYGQHDHDHNARRGDYFSHPDDVRQDRYRGHSEREEGYGRREFLRHDDENIFTRHREEVYSRPNQSYHRPYDPHYSGRRTDDRDDRRRMDEKDHRGRHSQGRRY